MILKDKLYCQEASIKDIFVQKSPYFVRVIMNIYNS